MSWATCETTGGTVAVNGTTTGTLLDSVALARFSTNDAGTYETYTDTGTGLNAVRFLQQGLYLIAGFSECFADTNALTAAQVATLRNSVIRTLPSELFGGGVYSLRTLIGDRFWYSPATGASARSAAGNTPFSYRSSGGVLLDLPATGNNLGDEYGYTLSITADTDLATGLALPKDVVGAGALHFFRLGDSVPVGSLPWW